MPSASAAGQMKRRRGRPKADPVDRLRVKIWYLAVKSRGDWSDYLLDEVFASEDGERRGADRLRAFETIRRLGTTPSKGTYRRRRFDLISRVDAHPDFGGTAVIFHSAFWDLLKARQMGPVEARDFARQCMSRCHVHRPSGKLQDIIDFALSERRHKNPLVKNSDLYAGALNNIVARMPLDLDTLALVGGLFREAYLVCSLETAGFLKRSLLGLLEKYSAQEWLGDTGSELCLLAERRILFWQMTPDFLEEEMYDDWPPAAVARPLMQLDEAARSLISQENELHDRLIMKQMRRMLKSR